MKLKFFISDEIGIEEIPDPFKLTKAGFLKEMESIFGHMHCILTVSTFWHLTQIN